MSKLGILGGSFNPIHLGHLILSEYIFEQFELSQIIFLVSYTPPHKSSQNVLSARERSNMVKLAIEDNPRFEISTLEFSPDQSSYTVHVLETLSEKYPTNQLNLIIGMDSLEEIKTWHEWQRLWEYANIIVAPRPDYSIDNVSEGIADRVEVADPPVIGITASNIRQRISEGKSIKYMVPQKVEDYIKKQGLYRAS